ncbi:hypothetical protein BDV96DRAFT_503933 [Lophiotrema nucula]|uniref:Uncharacterized protein n=1 Tax=Lophiotrema nucula TaxID=690887 RepID=A0A6A5YS48_9PLEO|nr:hypothetical protein BDV96DRAFT_503933 [Lophiotrema nucula]
MENFNVNKLMESISQLYPIQPNQFQAMVDEIQNANIPYKVHYDDYQSGGWFTAVLYAPDAKDEGNEGTVRDGVAKPTTVAENLPCTRQFLDGLGLEYFTVRIARTDPDAWLWEHRDYIELNEDKKRLRLHIPLVSNPRAIMQFSQCSVHLAPGWLWKLDPMVSHAISNTSQESRTHIILDCYVNETLREMLDGEILEAKNMRLLPHLDAATRKELLIEAHDLFASQGMEKAEMHLLKTFHRYDLGEDTSYDLLIDLYREMGFRARENFWIEAQTGRVYHREKIDSNPSAVCSLGTVFPNPHASVSSLAQSSILLEVLQVCRQYHGLEKAYVRGSLARGDADRHSDIDLLCVVAPEHFASFIQQVDDGIKQKYDAAADSWVDTIVKDFGGVGFVYLLQTNKGLYQLDLYVACQGHPSLQNLDDVPAKQLVFCKHGKDKSNSRVEFSHFRLHSEAVLQDIRRINDVESSVSPTITELCILAFMIKKCLERGDNFLADNEYNMWKRQFLQLVRQRFDTEHRDYGFYHVKRLITKGEDGARLYEDLCKLYCLSLSKECLVVAHHYAMAFAETHFPEEYAQQQKIVRAICGHIHN